MGQIRYIDLTSREAAEVCVGRDVVGLIPIGSVEQHGPHLPLGTDSLIADHLVAGIAAASRLDVLVAPTLYGGLSSHHLAFPGTVDLHRAVVAGYVESWVAAWTKIGVNRIALFSSHGGNFGLLRGLATRLSHASVTIAAYDDLREYQRIMAAGAERAGLHVSEADIHAGGLETSQMMFLQGEESVTLRDDLVGYVAAEPGWLERMLAEGVDAVSPIGVLGDPRGASAMAGAAVFESLVHELVRWLEDTFAVTRDHEVVR